MTAELEAQRHWLTSRVLDVSWQGRRPADKLVFLLIAYHQFDDDPVTVAELAHQTSLSASRVQGSIDTLLSQRWIRADHDRHRWIVDEDRLAERTT